MNLLKLVPLVIVLICIPLVLVTADTTFDSVTYEISCTIEGHCPHAMLIYPVNNSVINEVNVPLTVYIYDDDETVWELNITWYTNDSTIIDKQTVATDREVTTTWTNREPGQEYSWYVFVENSTGNITTGTFNFTIDSNPIFGSTYAIVLFLIFFGLNIIMVERKNTLPWYLLLFLIGMVLITQLSTLNLVPGSIEFFLILVTIILLIYYLMRGVVFLIFEKRGK